MNCHDQNNNDSNHQEMEQHKKYGMGKHMILMILCCSIPIVLLMILPFLNIEDGGLKSLLSIGIFLLCPLLHILMMGGMMNHSKKK